MPAARLLTLTCGPLALVSGAYWFTIAQRSADAHGSQADPAAVVETVSPEVGSRSTDELQVACEAVARALTPRLDPNCRAIVRSPYVLAGDLSEAEFERVERDVLRPVARALSLEFFDVPPTAPVTILLFATEESFRTHAERLDGARRDCYSGYYLRNERRIVLNAATGAGTIAHELTHALGQFDFPAMPEWFDEGLASLFEESEFSADGRRLRGRSNWRIQHVLQALHDDRLPSLEELVRRRSVRFDQPAIDYAHARYVCLYLQERDLLATFHRKFRTRVAHDPDGLRALRELFEVASLDEIEPDFRAWLRATWQREHAHRAVRST